MKTSLIAAVVWLCAVLAGAGAAQAERRVALVIGNSAYQHSQPLNNPVNDANAIAALLEQLGFEVVKGLDLTYQDFGRTVADFAGRLEGGADVGLFFFAGHGLQVKGRNYLVPVDASLNSEARLNFEAVAVDDILELMQRTQHTNIIILDACRDNPLARNLARNMGVRSNAVGSGLASVRGGIQTLISFSTQPGNVALDGTGKHSPFAKALLKHFEVPGLELEVVMRKVRQDVYTETRRKQVPWSESSLTRAIVFRLKPAESETPLRPEKPGEPDRPAQPEEPMPAASPAKNAVPFKPPVPATNPAEKTATDKTPHSDPVTPALSVKPVADEAPDRRDLAMALQRELRRVGCDPGAVDGVWRPKARQALADFARHARRSINASQPKPAALAAVRAKRSRVCPLACDGGEVLRNGKCVAPRGARSGSAAGYDGQYHISAVRTAHYRKTACLSSYSLTLAVNGGGAAHKLPFGHTLRGRASGGKLHISSERDADGGWIGSLGLSPQRGGRTSGYLKWSGGGMICEFRLSATRS